MEIMISLAALVFAPCLLEALRKPTPPGVAFFKALPSKKDYAWGVYVLVLEKAGRSTKLYVGSATHSLYGVTKRWGEYDCGRGFSLYVDATLDEGYTITHKGLLCTCPIPPPALVPTVRVLLLALEGYFAFAFWTMYFKTKHYGVGSSVRLWDIDLFEYSGLCSHSSLLESGQVDLNLTAEELEAHAQNVKAKRVEAAKGATRKHYDKSRATDLDLHRAKNKESVEKFRVDNPEKAKANLKKSQQNVKAQKKYCCPICDQAFPHAQALKRHNDSKAKQAIHEAAARKQSA